MQNLKSKLHKLLLTILIAVMIFSQLYFFPNEVNAETKTVRTTETITDIGYYDIWKHIDGTWQKGIKPGSSVSPTFTVGVAGAVGGKKVVGCTGEFYFKYNSKYVDQSVQSGNVSNCAYNDDQVTYTVSTSLYARVAQENIKKIENAVQVEGYRYYIPVQITLTLEEEVEIVKPPAVDPIEDLDAEVNTAAVAKTGETFTVSDATRVGSETVLDSSTLTRSVDGGAWEYVTTWNGTGSKGQNTGGSAQQTFDKVCMVEYKITSVTEGGKEDTGSKTTDIQDNRVVDGKAILQLHEYTYEGHPVEAVDCSEFNVDGTDYSARRAYEEGVASNRFIPIPNTVGQAKKTTKTTADVTFSKRGYYNVKLNIDTVTGQTLSDTKPIEVRKTPYVLDRIGGVQKQNRKQILNFSVATYPDKPIVDYYIEIRDMKTGESITLTKDKPQENNAFIKTRAHKTSGDQYWTNFDVEFLTKTPAYKEGGDNRGQEFRYTIYVKDSKGDTDSKQKVFTVVPDLPPNPQIIMQDTFIRNKGTNIAEISAEDGTTTDGDQVKRTWSAISHNEVTGNSEGDYQVGKDLPGYQDQSFGSGQKIKFDKTGVGNATVALHVKEIWNEPTLEEYVTDADYLEANTTKTTDVINIAPTVRLEPLDSEKVDILLLLDKTFSPAISSSINALKAALIEKGLDANVQLARTAMPDDGPMRMAGRWDTKVSINCFTCTRSLVMDSDRAYRVIPFGQVLTGGYQDVCVAPHTVEALEPSKNGEPQKIAWRYTVTESNDFRIKIDNEEKYVYLACNDIGKTIVLNRNTGAYITTLNAVLDGTIFLNPVSGSIYSITSSKIQKYQSSTGTLATIYSKGGSLLRLIDGKATFVGQTGQNKFYIGKFDLKEERLDSVEIPTLPTVVWASGAKTDISACDMDSTGKVTFVQGVKDGTENEIIGYYFWTADTKAQTITQPVRIGAGEVKMATAGFVKDEKGEGKYVYAATIDDHSSSKKTRVYFRLGLYTNHSTLLTSYEKQKSDVDRGGIIYAGIDTKENSAYIVQGSDVGVSDFGGLRSGGVVKIDLTSFVATDLYVNNSPMGWNLFDEVGYDNDSYVGVYHDYDRWQGMPSYINLIRKPLTSENAAISALRSKANFRDDAKKYVFGGTESEVFKNAVLEKGALAETFDFNNPITDMAEKIVELKDTPRKALLLKGNKDNLASLMKNYSLDPDTTYLYEYDAVIPTGSAVDVFYSSEIGKREVENTNSSKTTCYGKVIAEKDFGMPGGDDFFTYGSSYYLRDLAGLGAGYYGKRSERESFSCWVKFNMKSDGWVEFDYICGGSGNAKETRSIDMDGKNLLSELALNGRKIEHKLLFLGAGEHTISLSGYSGSFGFVGINNVKVGYLTSADNKFIGANMAGVEIGKMNRITNTFQSPKTPLLTKEPRVTGAIKDDMGEYASFYAGSRNWGVGKNSASIGAEHYWGVTGSMTISAPVYAALAVNFKESAGGMRYAISTSGGRVIDPNPSNFTVVIPKGEGFVRSYQGNSGKNGGSSVSIYDMKIAVLDENITNLNGVFCPGCLGSGTVGANAEDNYELSFGQNEYYYTQYKGIKDTNNAPEKVGISTAGSQNIFGIELYNFRLYKVVNGIKQLALQEWFNSEKALQDNGWVYSTSGSGEGKIVDVAPIKKDEEAPLVYKKGQLVTYNIFYDDYENDPSKKQYWKYTHTPMNDGKNPEAAVILDEDGNIVSSGGAILSASIPRFYIDGKYTVEHWQEDNTTRGVNPNGNPDYDKMSNVESITFYIEGGASAPWVTSIKTLPTVVKEGDTYKLQIGIDDVEKDELRLTTELYKDKKLIYTHKQTGIKANASGVYPLTITGDAPLAQGGKYEVVCTVRDWSGAGMGTYKFTVVSEGKITGYVNHTDQWNTNRKKYNLKKSGSEESPRGYNVFWSGEKFMLESAVAGSPTLVTSQIIGYSDYKITMKSTGRKNAQNETIYEGEMWDKSMINKWGRKAPQPLTFKFIATYSGGMVKTNDVGIIVDSEQDYWQLHRLF